MLMCTKETSSKPYWGESRMLDMIVFRGFSKRVTTRKQLFYSLERFPEIFVEIYIFDFLNLKILLFESPSALLLRAIRKCFGGITSKGKNILCCIEIPTNVSNEIKICFFIT